MRIQDMFEKDINRSINGVVKVAQDDDASIRSELEEYVITRELRKHFSTLLERYDAAIDTPTDKIGVWISGFFGSGKSHFLKMLSYLLSNREVAGKHAIDYFDGKFDDPLMAERARRCASVPCESILFNIDNKGPANKDKTAILKVFARVFYEHLGYYGENLRCVRLEQAIDLKGKRAEFRAEYERLTGQDWLETRDCFDFYQDDVIAALAASGVMSEEAATRWFDGSQTAELSIDTLVEDICEYVNKRRAESPRGTFRLLFMVDEVGQYIGADVNLMLNLQTLVEELGARCAGSVWVMVTSQEAIDEITHVVGNDFSKIQGRFNTRLSLSSSSVDEVIKARVLAKNEPATRTLTDVYAANAVALRNLFAFKDSRGDLQGYSGEEDFVETFPFAGYQFKVMQDVLTQLRTHGSSGKHLSGGERSMLSGFQEAAQAVASRDEYALVPFWRFYDTLSTFLEGYIRRVIDRCAEQAAEGDQGLMPEDVEVLKLLFLVRYVGDLKANLTNVTIMMADRMDVDVQSLRERVKGSLDRLERQNYIARNGEVYTFLTDDEQEIAREIDHQQVEPAQVQRQVANTVFADILEGFVKVRDAARDFPIDRYVDDQAFGSVQDALPLRVVTSSWHAGLGTGGEEYVLASSNPAQVLVVLNDEENYYACALRMLRIQKYVASKQGDMSSLPEKTRSIIAAYQDERRALEKELKRILEGALAKARVYAAGRELTEGRSDSARKRIEYALGQLVDSVYSSRELVQFHAQTEMQLRSILLGDGLIDDSLNARACQMMASYLNMQLANHQTVTMKTLQDLYQAKPFGWSEFDVAAVAAQLIHDQKARVRMGGNEVPAKDIKLPEYLHNRSQIAKAVIEARRSVPTSTLNGARALLRELSGKQDIPQDEDGLVEALHVWLNDEARELDGLLAQRYARQGYPGKPEVDAMLDLIRRVQGTYGDANTYLGTFCNLDDDLADAWEDLESVKTFFDCQVDQFDRACKVINGLEGEKAYLEHDAEACEALAKLDEIVRDPKPYGRIKEIASLANAAKAAHSALVVEKRGAILNQIEDAKRGVEDYAAGREGADEALKGLEERWISLRSQANSAVTCMALDALTPRLNTERNQAFSKVDAAVDRAQELKRQRELSEQRMAAEKTRLGQGGATGEGHVDTTHVPANTLPVTPAHVDPPQPPAAKTREVSCSTVCSPDRLKTEEDIDKYVADLAKRLKQRLHDALENGDDGIRLV